MAKKEKEEKKKQEALEEQPVEKKAPSKNIKEEPLSDGEVPVKKKKNLKKVMILIGAFALLGIVSALVYSLFMNYLTEIPEVKVPNVVGLLEEDAQTVLKQEGLETYLMGKRFSSDVSVNFVIETMPEAERRVKAGRKVGYVISLGKEGEFLPNLVGLTLDQAKTLINEKSFQLIKGGELFSSDYKQGVIVTQNPLGGQYFPKDATVNVFISSGYPVSINVSLIEPGYDRLMVKINLKVLDGSIASVTNVKIISIKHEESQILYNEDIRAGKELLFEIEEEIGARIEVYFNDILAKAQKVLF